MGALGIGTAIIPMVKTAFAQILAITGLIEGHSGMAVGIEGGIAIGTGNLPGRNGAIASGTGTGHK
jgi:hypothetical protein